MALLKRSQCVGMIGTIWLFLLAVFAYHERFGSEHLIAFVSIWLGIAIYVSDTVLVSKRKIS